MLSVRLKAVPCRGCQKMIAYSPGQEGTLIACPRCGEQMPVPVENAAPPRADGGLTWPSGGRPRRHRPRLLWSLCACLLAGVAGLLVALTLLMPNRVPWLCRPFVSCGLVPAVAPAPAVFRDTDMSVAVTKMLRGKPVIFQAAIGRTFVPEATVYCITVVLTNRGRSAIPFRSWRTLASAGDIGRSATLRDHEGRLYGTVSFGPETWPEGASRQMKVEPGASFTDILLFECGPEVAGDYLLTLPGENLGVSHTLRFRIPAERVL